MASVTWTEDALDVEAIGRYIGAAVSIPAALFIQSIFAAADNLEDFPNAGRIVPEVSREDIREIIVASYRVIYLVRGDRVFIITVHHGARPLGDIPA